MHNSLLLNRVSNYGEQIFMTLSAYMELSDCHHPAVITKDLTLLVYARDSKISAASRLIQEIAVLEKRRHLNQNLFSSFISNPLPLLSLNKKNKLKKIYLNKKKKESGCATAKQQKQYENSMKKNLTSANDRNIINNFSIGECVFYMRKIKKKINLLIY